VPPSPAPFGARRAEIRKASEAIPRREFVTARSVTLESAMPVHAALAGGRCRYYSRRERQGKSGRSFPGVRSRRGMGGTAAALGGSVKGACTTYMKKADLLAPPKLQRRREGPPLRD